jgi:hypothetical protein
MSKRLASPPDCQDDDRCVKRAKKVVNDENSRLLEELAAWYNTVMERYMFKDLHAWMLTAKPETRGDELEYWYSIIKVSFNVPVPDIAKQWGSKVSSIDAFEIASDEDFKRRLPRSVCERLGVAVHAVQVSHVEPKPTDEIEAIDPSKFRT